MQRTGIRYGLNFGCTNESLPAIVAGLEPKPEDRILTVLGSGDQTFALIEYASEVVALDYNHRQIAYARKRRNDLKHGRYDDFLATNTTDPNAPFYFHQGDAKIDARNAYFREEGRLDRIRERIGRLRMREDLIPQSLKPDEVFTRIYASNALQSGQAIESLTPHLSPGGLVYLTNGGAIAWGIYSGHWPKGFVIDKNLSQAAKDLEKFWPEPLVMRNIGQNLREIKEL